MSSLASNPTGFMSSQNKPFLDIKNLEPLILKGEFNETGVSIYFPDAYQDFFSQVFQEGVQILEKDKLTPNPRIFFSLEACKAGLFGQFLQLFEFSTGEDKLNNIRYLNLNRMVYTLTMPVDTLNELVSKNQSGLTEKLKDQTIEFCESMFKGLVNPAPKLKESILASVSPYSSSVASKDEVHSIATDSPLLNNKRKHNQEKSESLPLQSYTK